MDMVTVKPRIVPGPIKNPGKGWMLMMPETGPDEFAGWPWISLIYHRINWAELEPEEGRFTWDHPRWEGDGETNGFKRWTDAGYPVGLDVMCCNPHGDVYSTPKWVHDAGCGGRFYRRESGDPQAHGKVMDRWEPDYDDPIFKEKLENFLRAFAKRYDNDPAVEYVTLRSYAPWGEWWGLEASDETLNWMVDLHRDLFKKTTMLIPVSNRQRFENVIKPAIMKGLGVRKDGLGGPITPNEIVLCDLAYMHAPVMLEFYGARSYLMERGWDVLFDKEECIYGWHASRVNMGFTGQARQWVENEPDFLDRAGERMGYRFSIQEAAFSRSAAPGGEFRFRAWWRNSGVAPYTRPGEMGLILRDGAGRETVIFRHAELPNNIFTIGHYPIGEYPGDCDIRLPENLRAGEYDLLVAMEDHYKGRATPIRLAHENDEQGRITLGKVMIEG